MLLSLRSTEGVTVSVGLFSQIIFCTPSKIIRIIIFLSTSQTHLEEDKQFVLLDDDDDDDEEGDAILDEEEEETEVDDSDVAGYISVSHSFSLLVSYVRALIRIPSVLSDSVWKMLT